MFVIKYHFKTTENISLDIAMLLELTVRTVATLGFMAQSQPCTFSSWYIVHLEFLFVWEWMIGVRA